MRRIEASEGPYFVDLGETTNLYAEQDQIGSDPGVARSYCKYVSIGTGKVAGSCQQWQDKIDDHHPARFVKARHVAGDKTRLTGPLIIKGASF